MDYLSNNGAAGGKRLGLIVLQTDETLEFEARQLLAGHDTALFHARIPNALDVTPETLAAMEAEMPRTAALLPDGLDAIGYACTSGATVIGPETVEDCVQSAHPDTPVTNPISAIIAALDALNARRIAMVTPYVVDVTAPMRALLAECGVEVISEVSFQEVDDSKVARIDPASTHAAMIEAGHAPGVEAVFASCTNLQTFPIIDAVEHVLDLPVVTSNQALLWHMLRLSGQECSGWGPGRLFST
ncbi:Asp/Glu racemase [Roseovarius aestuarii]|nr:Asp/Glu racemase [Roseovarius aestuarii]